MAIGKSLFFIGLAVTAIGALLWLFPHAFAWFGRLPGDIRYESESTQVYAPFASMALLSVGVSLAVQLVRWLFR